ncbi:MAG: hypothetical protein ABI743_05970 [bacterium]
MSHTTFDNHGNIRQSGLPVHDDTWRQDLADYLRQEADRKEGKRPNDVDTDSPGNAWIGWMVILVVVLMLGLWYRQIMFPE